MHRTRSHGESGSILFHKWTGMKDRCYNANAKNYEYYGGRGIAICEEWRTSYEAFRGWANSNGYKDGLSLDRIDPDKDYSPDNCRWITMSAQASYTVLKLGRTLARKTKSPVTSV